MDSLADHRKLESRLLHTLCWSDPTAWCFLPFGVSRVQCCSAAFLQLWGLPHERSSRTVGPVSVDWSALTTAMAAYEVSSDILSDIANGLGGPGDGSRRLLRSDGRLLSVSWTVVPAGEQFRGGWLVRFVSCAEISIEESILENIREARRKLERLTEREQQVLSQLFDGRTNKAIAISMNISEKTVEKHRARIMQKLKVPNTARLFRLVSHAKLAELETSD